MKKIWLWLAQLIPDILAVAGAVALTRGAFLIATAAGWIMAGVLFLAAAVIWSKGGVPNDH